jgi:phosphatidylglycerol---prolipoprotein diacylglyceryl transferase
MHNDLFNIGPITIHGYGLMIAIGIACALLVAGRRAKKRKLNDDIVYGLGLAVLIFGFVGAKLLFCIVELSSIIASPKLILSGDGFVVYGGIIGGILAAMLYCKRKKVSFLKYFDLLAPSVALAQGFGRIGCFLAGCCYGCETSSSIGVVFHNSSFAPNGVKLLPTQLFSSAGDFLIAAVLIIFSSRPRARGKTGALYLILYGIGRFAIEFFRDDYRGSVGVLSTSQFISLIIFAIGIAMFFMKKLPSFKKEREG